MVPPVNSNIWTTLAEIVIAIGIFWEVSLTISSRKKGEGRGTRQTF